MTVNITISEVSGSDALADTIDLGSTQPSQETSIQDMFIRHDATVNPITDCAFYVTRYTGSSYLGDDADTDFTEIMAWGGAAVGDGFILNQVIPDGWTAGQQFSDANDQIFKNGYGDINSQLILDEDSINIGTPAGDGVIPLAGESHVQARCKIPVSVPAGSGYRAIQLVMAYSATS